MTGQIKVDPRVLRAAAVTAAADALTVRWTAEKTARPTRIQHQQVIAADTLARRLARRAR